MRSARKLTQLILVLVPTHIYTEPEYAVPTLLQGLLKVQEMQKIHFSTLVILPIGISENPIGNFIQVTWTTNRRS
jgi:hypothetical protein